VRLTGKVWEFGFGRTVGTLLFNLFFNITLHLLLHSVFVTLCLISSLPCYIYDWVGTWKELPVL